jgi:DNA-binding response OmpR family regulator
MAVIDLDDAFVAGLGARAGAAGLGFWRSQGSIGPATALSMKLDVLVLDPAALGQGCWDYLERIRGSLPAIGVLVCTGRSTVAERVRGLRLGADDWLTKPAVPDEVIARAQAIVRPRRVAADTQRPFEVGDLRLEPEERRAFLGGRDLELSRQEFDLLNALGRTTGEVVDRETIYRRAWGYAMAPGDRSVDTFIARLRAKLAVHRSDHTYIHTHFRIGYRFDPGG